jgi:hypothetical protein
MRSLALALPKQSSLESILMAENPFDLYDESAPTLTAPAPATEDDNPFSAFDGEQPPQPEAPANQPPAPITPVQNMPGVSVIDDPEMREFLDAFKAQNIREGTDKLNDSRGRQFIDGLTTLMQHDLELAKGAPSGAVSGVGTLMKGAQTISNAFPSRQLDVMDQIDAGDLKAAQHLHPSLAGYGQMTSAQREMARERLKRMTYDLNVVPVDQQPLYKAGEAVKKFAKTILPAAPGFEEAWSRQVSEGLGQMMVSIPVQLIGGAGFAGALYGVQGAGEAAERAVEYDRKERAAGRPGLTQEDIVRASIWGIGPGATDLLPIEMMLGRLRVPPGLAKPTAKVIGKLGGAAFWRITGQALVEGGQEGFQQALQNLIAKEYNPSQSLGEDILPSAGVGAGVGGVAQAGKEMAQLALRRFAGRRGSGSPAPQAAASPDQALSGGPEALSKAPEAASQPAKAPSSPPDAAPAPTIQRDAAPETRAATREQFNQYLALEDRLASIPDDMDAPPDLINQAIDAEEAMVESFRATGLPGDGLARGTRPIESMEDVKRAFDEATPEEINEFWQGKAIGSTASGAAAGAGTVAQGGPAGQARAATSSQEGPSGSPAAGASPALRLEKAASSGGATVYDAKIDDVVHAKVSVKLHPKDKAIEVLGIANDRKQGRLKPEFVNKIKAALAQELPDYETAFGKEVGESAPLRPAARDLTTDFLRLIASPTPRDQWAKTLGVSEDELMPHVERAIASGLLRVDRNGVVRRNASAVAEMEPEVEAEGQKIERAIESGAGPLLAPGIIEGENVTLTPKAIDKIGELQAIAEEAVAKILPRDVRIEVVDNIAIDRLAHEDNLLALRSSKSAKVSEGTEGESDESGLQEDSGEVGQAGDDASQSAGEGEIAAAVGGGGASGASTTEGRILRQESATLRADGSIRAGRISSQARGSVSGGLNAEALQPVGTSELFDAPGLRGVVTANRVTPHTDLDARRAPPSEYRLANLTYRLYADGTPIGDEQLTHDRNGRFQANFRAGGESHQPLIWAMISQHMDGTWEVSSVNRVAGSEAPKGLAAKLYAAIEKDLGIRMSPSGYLSPDGYAMWKKRSPESVKWHQQFKFDQNFYISPRRIKDRLPEVGKQIELFAAKMADNPGDEEIKQDWEGARKERGELIKLWSKLPEEARGATPNTMFSLRAAQDSQIMERAAAKYGVTRDPNEAGYILPDGRMLDFSGRSEISSGGATSRGEPFSEENVAGKRWLDHRDLDGVMDLTAFDPERMPLLDREMAEQTARMYDFMAQSGAVRYRQDFGFEVTAMPSPMQLRTILRHHQKEYSEAPLRVDVTDPSTGNIIASKAFPRPMLDAVSAFLREHYPPNTMFSLRGFYSPAIRAAESISMKKGTGEQFLKQITKVPGVRKDELEWMGLEEFLAGKPSVTRDEVLSFMRAHQVELDEKQLTNAITAKKELTPTTAEDVLPKIQWSEDWFEQADKVWSYRIGDEQYYITHGEEGWGIHSADGQVMEGDAANLAQAQHMLDGHHTSFHDDPGMAKFGDYKVPGGENYRELLIRLPSLGKRELSAAEQADIAALQKKIDALPRDDRQARFSLESQIADIRNETAAKYTSKHFQDQEIVHLRVDDRIGPNGEKVLFINEVQSDLHQAGRQSGYGSQNIHARAAEARAEIRRVRDEPDFRISPEREDELNRIIDEADALNDETGSAAKIPNAPFKGDLWLELALKRALLYASENGYDAISWARSDQIAKAVGAQPEKLALQYDSKIGKFLDKYTKKWGAKVEEAEGMGAPGEFHARPNGNNWDIVAPNGEVRMENVPSPVSAIVRELTEAEPRTTNPILRITPEMRTSVMQGQPLAMRRGASAPGATEALGQTNPDAKIISLGARAIEAESRATGKSEKKITIETIRHEALEFFLKKGFIRPDEWATLVDVAVEENWIEETGVRDAYTALVRGGARADGLFALAGKKAATADLKALGRAEEMERSGKDRRSIWDETGWYRGVDGQWRFEINDNRAGLGEAFTLNASGFIQNLFRHPDLYRAYKSQPFRGRLKTRQSAGNSQHFSGDDSIVAQGMDLGEIEGKVLHEIQHGIQDREGFARGTNWFMPRAEALQKAKSIIARTYGDVLERLDAVRSERDRVFKEDGLSDEYYRLNKEFVAVANERDAIREKTGIGFDPKWLAYFNSAGEVEARNVERRAKMTPEERRATPPWETQDVADEDQFVGSADDVQMAAGMSEAELEDLILKESIMVKYGEYERGNYTPKGIIAKIFKRIKDFLDRLRNSLKSQGFQRWEDIFQKMDAGEMRQRYEARFGMPAARVEPLTAEEAQIIGEFTKGEWTKSEARIGEIVAQKGVPTTEEITLYRGVSHGAPAIRRDQMAISTSDFEGGKGFSLARNQGLAEEQMVPGNKAPGFPVIKIIVPKGTRVLDLEALGVGSRPNELETILGAGKLVKDGGAPTERIQDGPFHYDIETYRFVPAESKTRVTSKAVPAGGKSAMTIKKGAKAAPLSPGMPAAKAGTSASAPGSLVDIQRELRRKLGLTVASGRLDPKMALAAGQMGEQLVGQFDEKTNVIRLKALQDIESEAHEVAHALEDRYASIAGVQQAHSQELDGVAALTGKTGLSEGFAEFFRLYLTNPPAADAHAPKFRAAFEDFLETQDAQTLQDIQEIQAQYQQWRNASSAGRITAAVKSGVPDGTWEKIRAEYDRGGLTRVGGMFWAYLEQVYKSRIDRTNPIRVLVERIARQAEANNQDLDLSAWRNPQTQARKISASDGVAYMDITRGVGWENAAGRGSVSLRDALSTAFGGAGYEHWTPQQRDDFGAYLIARRGRWLWQRFEMDPARNRGRMANPPQNPQNGDWYFDTMARQRRVYLRGRWEAELTRAPDKHTRADHEQAVADLEAANPQFSIAAQMVYQFNRDLALKRFQAGLDSQEEFDYKNGTGDYVPWFRDMTDRVFAGTGVSGREVQAKFKLRGSYRDFINPVEGIIRQVYDTNREIAVNKPKLLLAQLADSVKGAGKFAEIIPATRMTTQEVRVREALAQAAKQEGLPPEDAKDMISAVAAMIGDDAVAKLFRVEQAGEGGDAILHYMEGGELKMVQIHDDERGIARDILGFFELVKGTPASDQLFGIISAAVRVPQKAITSSLGFLYRNLIRDRMNSAVLQAGYFPIVSDIRTVASNRARRNRGEETWKELLARHGGIMGGIGRTDVQMVKQGRVAETRTDAVTLKPWERQFWKQTVNPWHEDFWRWAEWSEANTRQTLARISFDRAIKDVQARYPTMPKDQQTFVALETAVQKSRDYTDYSRMGDAPSQLVANRTFMFLNPSLQGPDKMIRALFLAQTNEGRFAAAQLIRKKIAPLFSHEALLKDLRGEEPQIKDLTKSELDALSDALRMLVTIGMISIIHLVLEVAFNDPDELEDKSKLERATSVSFTINGVDYRIPRGFDLLNVISNAVKAGYESWRREDPTSWSRFRETLWTSLVPAHSSPILDLYSAWVHSKNNFFGSDIEPTYMKGRLPEDRYRAYTSGLSKDIAKGVNEVAPFEVSPLMVEYTMNLIGADWSRDILRAYDVFDPNKPALRWQEYPFLRAARGLRGTRGAEEFWKLMGQDGAFTQAGASYREEAVKGKAWSRDDIRKFFEKRLKDEDAKAYSVMLGHYNAEQRRLHPMERAREFARGISGVMRDVASNRIDVPVTSKMEKRVEVSREVRAQALEILGEIGRREYRNALIALKRPGYENREPQPVKPYLNELKTISPEIHKSLIARITNADGSSRVYDYDKVRELWPETRQRLLSAEKRERIIETQGDVEFHDLTARAQGAKAMGIR